MKLPLSVAALVVLCAACPPMDGGADAGETVDPKLSAISEKIFQPRCSASVCHGGGSASPAGQLNLETGDVHAALVDVDSDTDPTIKRVVAGDPDASLLYLALKGESHGVAQMPKGSGSLDDFEIEAIKTWIEDGADDN